LIGTFDDLQPPVADLGDLGGSDWALVAAIGEDHLDGREACAGRFVQHQGRAVTILDAGVVDDDVQQQA